MKIYDYLSRDPIDLEKDSWYYEEKDGINIIIEVEPSKVKRAEHIKISWKKLEKSLERYKKLKDKEKT